MRNRFDRLVKDIAREGLGPTGTLVTDAEVVSDAQRADIWFEPDPARAAERDRLGLLGRLAATACMIEAFSDTPSAAELRACLSKHFAHWSSLLARRPSTSPPWLWILSTGRPAFLFEDVFLRPLEGWPSGVYDGPAFQRVRVVVLTELPRERSTLLVRMMGGNRVLIPATQELLELPEDAPERAVALEAVVRCHREVSARSVRTPEEEEFVMSTRSAVQELKDEGRQEGRQEALALALVDLYEARFGLVPPALRSAIDSTQDLALLRRWLLIVGTGTAEDVAQAIAPRLPDAE